MSIYYLQYLEYNAPLNRHSCFRPQDGGNIITYNNDNNNDDSEINQEYNTMKITNKP